MHSTSKKRNKFGAEGHLNTNSRNCSAPLNISEVENGTRSWKSKIKRHMEGSDYIFFVARNHQILEPLAIKAIYRYDIAWPNCICGILEVFVYWSNWGGWYCLYISMFYIFLCSFFFFSLRGIIHSHFAFYILLCCVYRRQFLCEVSKVWFVLLYDWKYFRWSSLSIGEVFL